MSTITDVLANEEPKRYRITVTDEDGKIHRDWTTMSGLIVIGGDECKHPPEAPCDRQTDGFGFGSRVELAEVFDAALSFIGDTAVRDKRIEHLLREKIIGPGIPPEPPKKTDLPLGRGGEA